MRKAEAAWVPGVLYTRRGSGLAVAAEKYGRGIPGYGAIDKATRASVRTAFVVNVPHSPPCSRFIFPKSRVPKYAFIHGRCWRGDGRAKQVQTHNSQPVWRP